MLTALLLQTNPTTTSPIVAYLTLFAAVIAAGASFYSTITASKTAEKAAQLAAETALEIKNREYRNDYHKRVVDKRMLAIERIDAVIALFRPIKRVSETDVYHSFFLNKEHEQDYEKSNSQLLALSTWIDGDTYDAIRDFNKEVRSVMREYKTIMTPEKRREFLVSKYTNIESQRRGISKRLIIDLRDLDNIDSFIKKRESYLDKVRN